jgi:hypothetical protein
MAQGKWGSFKKLKRALPLVSYVSKDRRGAEKLRFIIGV